MKLSSWVVITAVTIAPAAGVAQARATCKARPSTLAQMRDCYRPLLVFAPSATDARLRRQESILDQDADDMMDRFVLLVPIAPAGKPIPTPLDAPYVVLSPNEMTAIRDHFHVAPSKFEAVLIGEDGTAKIRSNEPIPSDRLNALIDSMPTRKQERLRPHAN